MPINLPINNCKEVACPATKFKIIQDNKNHCLKLQVSLLSPPASSPVVHEQVLFLDKEGHFNSHKNDIQQSFIKNISQEAALLELPGVEGEILVKPNGEVILGKLKIHHYLKCSTDSNITIIDAISAKKLMLQGKIISSHQTIESSQDIFLEADQELINHHFISAQNLKITGKGRFLNAGVVNAQKLLRLDIQTIENRGSLIGEEKLNFNGCHTALNHPSGEVLSFGNITIEPTTKFKNEGYISTPKKIAILGKSESSARIQASCTFSNTGLIQGLEGIFTANGICSFRNEETGRCIGKALYLGGKEEFYNAGFLMAARKLCIGSDGKNSNAQTGKIYSEQDVEILGIKEFENLGEVTGHENVTVKTIGRTLNGLSGEMNGKLLSLMASTLKNESKITALESLMIAVRYLYNDKNGSLDSRDKINIEASTLLRNKGRLSGHHIAVLSGSLFNKKTSKIESYGDLCLQIKKKLDNEGLIQADGALKLATEFLNNAKKAYIGSKQKAEIEARHMNNRGTIEANILFLKVASKFSNSESARLKAKRCLEIYSKNLENQGKIEGEDRVLLEASRKIVNSLTGSISAQEWLQLECGETIENSAHIACKKELILKALLEFDNLAGGQITAHTITAKTNVFRNENLFQAEGKLDIEAKYLLYNLTKGIILAGEKAELFSKNILQNSGNIASNGNLQLKADILLQNLREGTIVSEQDMTLLAGHVLSNAGVLLSKKELLMKSGNWITNEVLGVVRANGNLSITSEHELSNLGEMYSAQNLSLQALEIIKNNGLLQANKTISALARVFTNQNEIVSNSKVVLDVKLILENCQSGKIQAAEAVQLCSACILQNAGTVQSARDITAKSEMLLQNLAGGVMQAGQNFKLFSDFILNNKGLLLGEQIRLKATETLCNLSNGEIIAKEHLEGDSKILMNEGGLRSYGTMRLRARTLLNLSSGEISAKRALEIFTDNLHNENSIAAEKIKIEADNVYNNGSITSIQDLSLKIKNIFAQTANGKLSSEGTISLLAKDLYLAGQMISKGTLSLEKQNLFHYDKNTIWVCGLLKLMLNNGYNFDQPLEVLGSLNIEANGGSIHVNASVGATETTSIHNRQGSLLVEKEGISAGKQLNVDAGQVKINPKAYLASQGTMNVKAESLRNDGTLYAKADMILEALAKIENTGNIIGKGNVHIIAPIIEHFKLNELSDKPIIAAEGNCVLKGNVDIRDGDLAVKGKFTALGGSFRVYSTEEEKAKEAHRKAVKKAKKKRKLAILKTVVAMGVAAYFAPILAPKLLAGLGKLGLVLSSESAKLLAAKVAEGMVSGAINSAITGNNILKGSLQSGLFAGFSGGLDQILGNTFKNAPDILRKALVEGGTSGLQSLLEKSDDVSKNMLLGAFGSVLGQVALSTYQKNPIDAAGRLDKLTFNEIIKLARDSFVHSVANSSLKSVVNGKINKTKLEQVLLSGAMGAVQSAGGALGREKKDDDKISNNHRTQNDPRTPRTKISKEFSESSLIGSRPTLEPLNPKISQGLSSSPHPNEMKGTKTGIKNKNDLRMASITSRYQENRNISNRVSNRHNEDSIWVKALNWVIPAANASELDTVARKGENNILAADKNIDYAITFRNPVTSNTTVLDDAWRPMPIYNVQSTKPLKLTSNVSSTTSKNEYNPMSNKPIIWDIVPHRLSKEGYSSGLTYFDVETIKTNKKGVQFLYELQKGFNLSRQKQIHHYAVSETEVNALKVAVNAQSVFESNRMKTKIALGAGLIFSLYQYKGNLSVNKICDRSHCYELNMSGMIGLGAGLKAGISASLPSAGNLLPKHVDQDTNLSVSLGGGGSPYGLGPLLGTDLELRITKREQGTGK